MGPIIIYGIIFMLVIMVLWHFWGLNDLIHAMDFLAIPPALGVKGCTLVSGLGRCGIWKREQHRSSVHLPISSKGVPCSDSSSVSPMILPCYSGHIPGRCTWLFLIVIPNYCHSSLYFGIMSKPYFPQAFSFECKLSIFKVNYTLPLGTFLF